MSKSQRAIDRVWLNDRRCGFSLVEILVVISLMTLLLAIAMPAMNRARESGRDAQCKSNLRQIGLGLSQYAATHSTLCSGAWDWKHDGCVSEVGWVADLVSQGILVGQLNCPSNTAQLSEQFQTLLTLDAASNKCANSLGNTSRTFGGVPTDNICRELAALSQPEERVPLLEELIEGGYNTNYVASWFLVRSDVVLTNTGLLSGNAQSCPASLINRSSTVGPMNQARMGMAQLSSSIVPLMGCGQIGDLSDSLLSNDIGPFSSGTRLSEGTTDGPVDPVTMKVPVVGDGTGLQAWGPYWTRTLQDFRDFGPVHSRACNVLFLDGSVSSFSDENHDGYLNNGFKPSSNNPFVNDTIELPAAHVYSGWSMNPSRIPRRRVSGR